MELEKKKKGYALKKGVQVYIFKAICKEARLLNHKSKIAIASFVCWPPYILWITFILQEVNLEHHKPSHGW